MTTEAFTVRAETDIVHQLDSMVWALDCSRNYLVNQVLREYLKTHAWQVDKISLSQPTFISGSPVDAHCTKISYCRAW